MDVRFVMTTMTTVGYGEYTPDDATGRMFAMMAAFAAMLLLAMMSAILAKFVELKYNESVPTPLRWLILMKASRLVLVGRQDKTDRVHSITPLQS